MFGVFEMVSGRTALIALGVGVLILIAAVGGLQLGPIGPPISGNMVVTFTVSDPYSSTAIPDTCDLYVYVLNNGLLESRDSKLDLTSGDVDSVLSYKTGEMLKIRLYDPTDTSYCTTYWSWTVPAPSASELENAKFKCDLTMLNMDDANNDGTMDWDPAIQENNGTAIAASGTVDVTASSYNTNYAYWKIFIYNNDDDTGYTNSYNFEDDVKNNAYLFLDFSGTGWDRVSIRSGATAIFSRNNHLYAAVPLSDDALSRDLDPGAGFVGTRNGVHQIDFTFDFTASQSGDSVTLSYGIRYYSDWDNFVNLGSWGIDTGSISESITVQY